MEVVVAVRSGPLVHAMKIIHNYKPGGVLQGDVEAAQRYKEAGKEGL